MYRFYKIIGLFFEYWITLRVSNCHQVLRLLLICLPPLRFVALLATEVRTTRVTREVGLVE